MPAQDKKTDKKNAELEEEKKAEYSENTDNVSESDSPDDIPETLCVPEPADNQDTAVAEKSEQEKQNFDFSNDVFFTGFTVDYSREEAASYVRSGRKPILGKSTLIYCIIFAVIGCLLLIADFNLIIFFVTIFIVIMPPGFNLLSELIAISRYYKKTEKMWNGEKKVRIYECHTETEKDGEITYHLYDDYYKIKDTDTRVYLIAGRTDMTIIDKDKVSTEIVNAMLSLKN